MEILLKEARRKRDLKQTETAKKPDIDCTYGSWEHGERTMNLEQAYNCAVVLGCSIGAIAGRPLSDPSEFSDPREAKLHHCYRSCDRDRQDRFLDTACDFAGMSRDVAERDQSPAEGGKVA
ncbi:helix-turn-helix transcriptional regulator [Thermophilibacter sp.]|uniref:helix-turn-helix transcriptional regulator n=1 Tax=Thermophilibacter sp. TaxID=2847309 RepID=UPI003A92CE6F